MKQLALALLCATLLFGCKKEDDEVQPIPEPTPAPVAHDLRLVATCTGTYYLDVSHYYPIYMGWVAGDTTINFTASAGDEIAAIVSNSTTQSSLRLYVDDVLVRSHSAAAGAWNPILYQMP